MTSRIDNLVPMAKTIAHRGSMKRGLQNSPEGVRRASELGVDWVELDVVRLTDGSFGCVHGFGRSAELRECLAEMSDRMGLVAHLKGRFDDRDLKRLLEEITRHLPIDHLMFAAHGTHILRRLRHQYPQVRLARFGLLPALIGLWKSQPWDCCMVNQLVLMKWHVQALKRRGFEVIASCVWELRSRRSVLELGVDGVFVNLFQ